MKAYKIVLLVLDFDSVEDVVDIIENTKYPNRCISPKVMSSESVEIGEWCDEHPLNHRDKIQQEFASLFNDDRASTKKGEM